MPDNFLNWDEDAQAGSVRPTFPSLFKDSPFGENWHLQSRRSEAIKKFPSFPNSETTTDKQALQKGQESIAPNNSSKSKRAIVYIYADENPSTNFSIQQRDKIKEHIERIYTHNKINLSVFFLSKNEGRKKEIAQENGKLPLNEMVVHISSSSPQRNLAGDTTNKNVMVYPRAFDTVVTDFGLQIKIETNNERLDKVYQISYAIAHEVLHKLLDVVTIFFAFDRDIHDKNKFELNYIGHVMQTAKSKAHLNAPGSYGEGLGANINYSVFPTNNDKKEFILRERILLEQKNAINTFLEVYSIFRSANHTGILFKPNGFRDASIRPMAVAFFEATRKALLEQLAKDIQTRKRQWE